MAIANEKLGGMIKMIHFTFESRINEVLKKYDLTRAQCDIIMFLVHNDGEVSQRMIEKALHVSNPTVTGLLNRLECKQFIERKISKKDARFKYIVLTDKARYVVRDIMDQLDANEEQLFSFLDYEEREQLRELLKKIIMNL